MSNRLLYSVLSTHCVHSLWYLQNHVIQKYIVMVLLNRWVPFAIIFSLFTHIFARYTETLIYLAMYIQLINRETRDAAYQLVNSACKFILNNIKSKKRNNIDGNQHCKKKTGICFKIFKIFKILKYFLVKNLNF